MSKALANLKTVNRSSMYAMCEALCDAAIEILEHINKPQITIEPWTSEELSAFHTWKEDEMVCFDCEKAVCECAAKKDEGEQ